MSGDRELTQAELFDVFSNARRRQTVSYLSQCGGSCQLASLVDQVAAWENDTSIDEVTRTQRRRVYISLYQTHLPMLADHGVIDWDPEGHTIQLLPDESVFAPYLADPASLDRSWHRVYLGLVVAGTGLLLLVWLSASPLSSVPPLVVGGTLSAAFLVVALVQRSARSGTHTLDVDVNAGDAERSS